MLTSSLSLGEIISDPGSIIKLWLSPDEAYRS
jgi:hypothetical protein